MKGEKDKTKLARDKPVGSMSVLEGQCTSDVLQSAVSVEVGDGDTCNSKDTGVMDVLEITEVPENGCMGPSPYAER